MEVSLAQMLLAREKRVETQNALLEKHQKPLICLTLNIPGPCKNSPLISWGFSMGLRQLDAQLSGSGIPVLFQTEKRLVTGCEGYIVADAEERTLKMLCMELEQRSSLGRLFDFDVLTVLGEKMSRQDFSFPERKCLICGKPAFVCSRSRTHSLSELQSATETILTEAFQEYKEETVSQIAVKALLQEVITTPKPGLVDRNNAGSHRDMDLSSFLSSSTALYPYFRRCVRIGMETAAEPPKSTFSMLRCEGKLAENAMYEATDGSNTHKGAIFTMGIFCAAAGRLRTITEASFFNTCKAMAEGITAECGKSDHTFGQKLFAKSHVTGIRGQAEAGFPAVQAVALPLLRHGLQEGLSILESGRCVLLHILCCTEDTSFLHRARTEECEEVLAHVRALLSQTAFPKESDLLRLDAMFIEKNLSPGGSADLLAACYFVHFLLSCRDDFLLSEESHSCLSAQTT